MVDKYEYKLKFEQIKALSEAGDYEGAAEIADTIQWRKVKNINLLIKAGDVYSKLKRFDEAKEILHMAYDRSPIGRMIIYRLAEIAVKTKNFEDAEEYYHEFVEIAPRDNLKYVLRYKISKAKGADLQSRITILEELNEAEYTEEWAFELAYLYHRAGENGKCIDACDKLILWFGEGIYVERAMELKMLYQPLSKSQEDKYRIFKRQRDGVKEVYPKEDDLHIRAVQENVGKYNTANLQEELKKSMQQIAETTGKEAAAEPEPKADGYAAGSKTTAAGSRPAGGINGWERTSRAAQAALQMAKQQRLEADKAKALQEAEDIMDRLVDVIPKLDAEIAPNQLLREKYLSESSVSTEERAGRYMAGMNDMLQQQIDRFQEEENSEPELLRKIKQAKPSYDGRIGVRPYIPRNSSRFKTVETYEEQPLPKGYENVFAQGKAAPEGSIGSFTAQAETMSGGSAGGFATREESVRESPGGNFTMQEESVRESPGGNFTMQEESVRESPGGDFMMQEESVRESPVGGFAMQEEAVRKGSAGRFTAQGEAVLKETAASFVRQEEFIPEAAEDFVRQERFIPEAAEDLARQEEPVPEAAADFSRQEELIPEEKTESFARQERFISEAAEDLARQEELIPEAAEDLARQEELIPGAAEGFSRQEELIPEEGIEGFARQERFIPEEGIEGFARQERFIPEAAEDLARQEELIPEAAKGFPRQEELIPEEETEGFTRQERFIPEAAEGFARQDKFIPEEPAEGFVRQEDSQEKISDFAGQKAVLLEEMAREFAGQEVILPKEAAVELAEGLPYEEGGTTLQPDPELMSEEDLTEEMRAAEAEFYGIPIEALPKEPSDNVFPPAGDLEFDLRAKQDTKEIKAKLIAKILDQQAEEIVSEDEEAVPMPKASAEHAQGITELDEGQKAIFSYFVPVPGMESQICQALTATMERFAKEDVSSFGNILIQGPRGCGKTILAKRLVKALQKELQRQDFKLGKIDAEKLNEKDLSGLLKKMAGGCLLIERAGELTRETAVKLSLLLENDSSGILVILEDTRVGLEEALRKDEGFARKFTEKIKIPVFTSDELVEFGRTYAHERDYEIDNMGVLALYNRISNIQRLDQPTTLTEVKDIIDRAIVRAEKKSWKKAFSILTSRRYTEDDYIILREKDFEE